MRFYGENKMKNPFLFSIWIGLTLGNLLYFFLSNNVKQMLVLELAQTLTIVAIWISLKIGNKDIKDR